MYSNFIYFNICRISDLKMSTLYYILASNGKQSWYAQPQTILQRKMLIWKG